MSGGVFRYLIESSYVRESFRSSGGVLVCPGKFSYSGKVFVFRRSLPMSGGVFRCPAKFSDVRRSLPMSGGVFKCPAESSNVQQSFQISGRGFTCPVKNSISCPRFLSVLQGFNLGVDCLRANNRSPVALHCHSLGASPECQKERVHVRSASWHFRKGVVLSVHMLTSSPHRGLRGDRLLAQRLHRLCGQLACFPLHCHNELVESK